MKKTKILKEIILTSIKLLICFNYRTSVIFFLKNVIFRKDNNIGKIFHKLQYESVKKVLRRKYSGTIGKYKRYEFADKNKIIDCKNIWFIWWQGIEDNSPGKIRENIDRIHKMNPEWNIKIISKYNYADYVEFNPHIEDCVEKNKISMTHVSDYIRVLLLRKHGGIYIDCNFFILNPISDFIESTFFTIKHGLYSDFHVCKGLWTTGFMAAGSNNILFCFLEDMYNNYLSKYDFIPSYFFIDALISIGYEDIILIRKEIDNIPYNNKNYNFINTNGNEQFDEKKWNEIIKGTYLFNVNYKIQFKKNIDGKQTYFSYLYS